MFQMYLWLRPSPSQLEKKNHTLNLLKSIIVWYRVYYSIIYDWRQVMVPTLQIT